MGSQLSQKDLELVAVGASVAAGCIPCTRYHVGAVQAAGATTPEIVRAVEVAVRVKREAAAIMEHVARAALGLEPQAEETPADDDEDRLSRLVALAAAVAVNCPTSWRRYAGPDVGRGELARIVALARMIRGKAIEKADATANARGASPSAATATEAGGCGCGSNPGEATERSVEAAHEAVADQRSANRC